MNMEITLRPIPHGTYVASDADAISCTYNMDGFTPMNAVLVAHGVERAGYTTKVLADIHSKRGFCAITHGDTFPNVITSSATEAWDSISDAPFEILGAVEDDFCQSLCFTQFSYVQGSFPEIAFGQLMLAAELAEHFTSLEKIVVDVDEKYIEQAKQIWQKVKLKLTESLPEDGLAEQDATLTESLQLDAITSNDFLHERAETGDTKCMTQLGQHYRNQKPILALKWLTLASFRGSKVADVLIENLEQKMTDEKKTVGYRLSLLWLADQIKKIEAHRESEMSAEFVAWMKNADIHIKEKIN